MKFNQDVMIAELERVVGDILAFSKSFALDKAVVIALHGDLGAGKTTFVQTVGRLLGVSEDITSPTFTIMKGYETNDSTFTRLIHMDAYRIEDLAELGPLRTADILNTPHTLFCVEWAEKIQKALPPETLSLTLTVVDETTRHIEVD